MTDRAKEIAQRWLNPHDPAITKLDDDLRWLVTELEIVQSDRDNALKRIEEIKEYVRSYMICVRHYGVPTACLDHSCYNCLLRKEVLDD